MDVSWTKQTKGVGLAWLLDNQDPLLLQQQLGGGSYGLAMSAFHAETQGCLKVVSCASQQHLRQITFYTDNVNLVISFQELAYAQISIKWTLQQIKSLVTNFNRCFLLKVMNRQQVQKAHNLVKNCAQIC